MVIHYGGGYKTGGGCRSSFTPTNRGGGGVSHGMLKGEHNKF